MSSFKEAVEAIVKANEKMQITSGEVKEVRADDFDVKREGLPDLLNVRFKSVLNATETSFKVVPKLGTTVLCGIIENNISEAVLIACSEIEKVSIKIGSLKFDVENDGVRIENQQISLKTVLNDLQDEIGKLCTEVSKIATKAGETSSPPLVAAIKTKIAVTNKNELNQILIE